MYLSATCVTWNISTGAVQIVLFWIKAVSFMLQKIAPYDSLFHLRNFWETTQLRARFLFKEPKPHRWSTAMGCWLMVDDGRLAMFSALWITTCCIKTCRSKWYLMTRSGMLLKPLMNAWWFFFIRIRTKVGFTIAGAIVVIQYFISFIKGEEVTAEREKVLCNSDHYFLFFSFFHFKRPPSFNGVSLQR